MAGTNGGGSQKHRFTPDVLGLNAFVDQFMVIWKLFDGILDILEGSAKAVEKFGERKQNLVRHASRLVESGGRKNDFSRTIGYGVHLMHDIEDFLEALVALGTADPYFDSKVKKIRELSEEVWAAYEVAVLGTRAKFTTASAGEDLVEVVGYYAEVLRHLKGVEQNARDAAASARRQRDATVRADRENKAKSGVRTMLATLA